MRPVTNERPRRKQPPAGGERRFPVPSRARIWLILVLMQVLVCSGGLQITSALSPASNGAVAMQSQRVGEPAGPFGDSPRDPVLDERRFRLLNAERHKTMVHDAAKLLRLATELKAELDKEEPASLTPEEIHKWAEIEKLARSVKEKMRTSVRMPSISPVFGSGQLPAGQLPD